MSAPGRIKILPWEVLGLSVPHCRVNQLGHWETQALKSEFVRSAYFPASKACGPQPPLPPGVSCLCLWLHSAPWNLQGPSQPALCSSLTGCLSLKSLDFGLACGPPGPQSNCSSWKDCPGPHASACSHTP